MAEDDAPKKDAPPKAGTSTKELPESARDELLLKFVGTGTLVVGLVLLVAGVVAISILSIMKFDIGPWLPVIPLSLLVVLIGGIVNGYYRAVLDRIQHPEKAAQAQSPSAYPYPYWYPMPTYPSGAAPPASAIPRPAAPTPTNLPPTPFPLAPPLPVPGVPDLESRLCVTCGRRIPVQSRFCPYCRHAYPA